MTEEPAPQRAPDARLEPCPVCRRPRAVRANRTQVRCAACGAFVRRLDDPPARPTAHRTSHVWPPAPAGVR